MKKLTQKQKRMIAQQEHDQRIEKVVSDDPDFFPCTCKWSECTLPRGHARSATLRLGWSKEFTDLDLLIRKSDTSWLLPDRICKGEDVSQRLKQCQKSFCQAGLQNIVHIYSVLYNLYTTQCMNVLRRVRFNDNGYAHPLSS